MLVWALSFAKSADTHQLYLDCRIDQVHMS